MEVCAIYGVSGFLAPDGTFYECDFMEHGELANILIKMYKVEVHRDINTNCIVDFIKLGFHPGVAKEGNRGCHVFFSTKPSNEQVSWLTEHHHKMTDAQRTMLYNDLSTYGIQLPGLNLS